MKEKIQTVLLVLACLAGSANAASSYLNQPDWLQAVGNTNGLTVFSFQGPTETDGRNANDTNIVPSYSSQGVDFLPFTGTTIYPVIHRGQQYQISAPDHDGLLANDSSPNPVSDLEGRAVKFNFNIPVYAVGVFFNGPLLGGDYGYLEAFDRAGNLISQTPVCAAGGFVGMAADTAIAQVHIVNTGNADITFGIWDLQFIPASAQTCVSPPSGLVAWWPGEGDFRDLTGTNNGTPVGGVAFVPGKVGQAFSLDGVSGNVGVPGAPSLDDIRQFTVLAWVYPTVESGAPDKVGIILDKETGALVPTEVQYELGRRNSVFNTDGLQHIPAGNLAFFIGGVAGLPDEGGNWVDGYASLPSGTWTHVAITFDGAVVRAFTNGVVTRQLSVSGFPVSTNGTLRIGARTFSPPESCWAGLIDEPAVFNRALSSGEITAIYAAQTMGMCKPLRLSAQMSGNSVAFSFQSVSNQSYTVQQNTNLATTNWSYYTNLTGNGSLLQLIAPGSAGPQMFFRVKRP